MLTDLGIPLVTFLDRMLTEVRGNLDAISAQVAEFHRYVQNFRHVLVSKDESWPQ